jgi:hypothetical protein
LLRREETPPLVTVLRLSGIAGSGCRNLQTCVDREALADDRPENTGAVAMEAGNANDA